MPVLLIASCALSFGVALWAFSSGAGLLAAFLVYSLGGSALMMALTAISYMTMDDDADVEFTRMEIFRARVAQGNAEAADTKALLAI